MPSTTAVSTGLLMGEAALCNVKNRLAACPGSYLQALISGVSISSFITWSLMFIIYKMGILKSNIKSCLDWKWNAMRCSINVVLLPLMCILVFYIQCQISYYLWIRCSEDILLVYLNGKGISFFLLGRWREVNKRQLLFLATCILTCYNFIKTGTSS